MSSSLLELPLFPLNSVIFPGGALPLRIFETRYLDMVKECMREGHGFGIVLIKQGQESGKVADIYNTGTECRIDDWETLPDGLLGITAYGESKIDIEDTYIQSNQLLVGHVKRLQEEPDTDLPEEFVSMRSTLQKIVTQIGSPYSNLPSAYNRAGWVGARLTELLPLQSATKQRLLEIDDHIVRLYHLQEAIHESKILTP